MKWANERMSERMNVVCIRNVGLYLFTSVRPPARPRATKATYPPTTHSSIWYDGLVRDAFYINDGAFSHTWVRGCEYTSENHSYPQPRHWLFYAIYGKRLSSLAGLWKVSQPRRFAWRVCAYNLLYCISLRACVRACVRSIYSIQNNIRLNRCLYGLVSERTKWT